MLVGIFTFGAEVYQAATVRSEAPYQFLAQQPSGAVLVDSDVDELLGFEVAFYEAIHPVEVALCAGGTEMTSFRPTVMKAAASIRLR